MLVTFLLPQKLSFQSMEINNNFQSPKRGQPRPQIESHGKYMKALIVLRIMASLATFIAALIMALNKESRDLGGFQLSASYRSSTAFVFFVIGNAVVCGYSLISLPFVFNGVSVRGHILPLLDLVSMGLVMASVSAAAAIAYVGKRGEADIGWGRICPYVTKFCDRVGISLVISFLGLLLTFITCSLSSVYKTKLITNA